MISWEPSEPALPEAEPRAPAVDWSELGGSWHAGPGEKVPRVEVQGRRKEGKDAHESPDDPPEYLQFDWDVFVLNTHSGHSLGKLTCPFSSLFRFQLG